MHHGRLDGVLLLAKPSYRKSDLARMLRVALGGETETQLDAVAQLRHVRSAQITTDLRDHECGSLELNGLGKSVGGFLTIQGQ